MEYTGSQCRIGVALGEHIAEMCLAACSTTGNDGYLQVVSQLGQCIVGIAGFYAIVVHASEQNLTSSALLCFVSPLEQVAFCTFASTFQVAVP